MKNKKNIISLSSDEFVQKMVKIKFIYFWYKTKESLHVRTVVFFQTFGTTFQILQCEYIETGRISSGNCYLASMCSECCQLSMYIHWHLACRKSRKENSLDRKHNGYVLLLEAL